MIGIDVPSVDGAVNAVSPHARAVMNVRVHPEQDAAEAQAAVIAHLRAARPFGIELDVRPGPTGNGFAAATGGPAYAAARRRGRPRRARRSCWPAAAARSRSSARSRARCRTRRRCSSAPPTATRTSTGPNERVLLDEFEKATTAEADFLGRYAEASGT